MPYLNEIDGRETHGAGVSCDYQGTVVRPEPSAQEKTAWFVLTANLDRESTATAHILEYDAATEAYTENTDDEYTLKDLSGSCWGIEGENIQARKIRGNGTRV